MSMRLHTAGVCTRHSSVGWSHRAAGDSSLTVVVIRALILLVLIHFLYVVVSPLSLLKPLLPLVGRSTTCEQKVRSKDERLLGLSTTVQNFQRLFGNGTGNGSQAGCLGD